MKVLYDSIVFTSQRFGGVSKCFCELIANRPPEFEYEIAIKSCNNTHLLQSGLVKDLHKAKLDSGIFCSKIGNIRGARRLYSLLQHVPFFNCAEKEGLKCTIAALKRGNYDVFHSTTINNTFFYKYLNGKPFVYTVHDMTQERLPQFFGANCKITALKRDLCKHASAIVAVSERSKKDLMELFGVPERKITVVYHGGPQPVKIKDEPLIKGEYFLFVGQRFIYKNFIKTLEDFSNFYTNHKDVKLVCTGYPFNSKEQELIDKLNIQNAVIQKRVSDYELKNLFNYAIALIYPSLYEGFGMPTLEAFAQGCPCLLNNNSCFPEVGGDAAFYFESDGINSNLPSVMEEVYNMNSQERLKVIQKGYEQLNKFSWKEAAKKLFSVYKSII